MTIKQDNLKKHLSPIVSKETKSSIQIARQLHQQYETDVGIFFAEIAKLPLKSLCKTLVELPSDIFEEAFSRIPHKKMAPAEQAEAIHLSQFSEDQAGAYMQMEMLVAELTETLLQVKHKVRTSRQEEPNSPIIKLFVVDAERHLTVTLH